MTNPSRFHPGCVALVLGCVAALPYIPTLTNGLVWDDLVHIVGNRNLATPAGVLGYFKRLEGLYFRPAIFLTFAGERALWGVSPLGYHLTNLLLHAAGAALLFHLASATGLGRRAAVLAGAIFALHPIQTEAVAYVAGRTDLLVTVAALGAWAVLLPSDTATFRAMMAAGATAVAILSKESGFALALLVPWLVYRHETTWRRRLVLAGPTVAVAVILLLVRPGRLTVDGDLPVLSGIVASGRAVVSYAALVLWPANLHIDRLTPIDGTVATDVVAGAVVLLCIVSVGWALRRGGPAADWTAWTVAFYLPVANLVALYPAIAAQALFTPEHNLYAPMAGLAVLAALAWQSLAARVPYATAPMAVAVCALLVAWGARTAVRTLDWRDEERLFGSAVRAAATSPRVWYNYGNALMKREALAEAAEAFDGAVRLAPNDADAWNNLGVALQRIGRDAEALVAYQRAVERAGLHASAPMLENLGLAHLRRGDVDAARTALTRASTLDPTRTTARLVLQGLPPAPSR